MEDKYLVAKTILECYSHLDDLYESLSRRSEAAVRSGFYAIFPSEQMRLYEKIITLEDRKVGLYNMKYLIEECFRRGRTPALSLLKEKYIERAPKEDLMKKYGVCLRTCYRYVRKGIVEFTDELEKMGFDKLKLLTSFGDEPLFQTMLTKVIRWDDQEGGESPAAPAAVGESETINRRRSPLRPDSTYPLDSGALGRSGRARPYA